EHPDEAEIQSPGGHWHLGPDCALHQPFWSAGTCAATAAADFDRRPDRDFSSGTFGQLRPPAVGIGSRSLRAYAFSLVAHSPRHCFSPALSAPAPAPALRPACRLGRYHRRGDCALGGSSAAPPPLAAAA